VAECPPIRQPWTENVRLAPQARLIERLAQSIALTAEWRWLEVSCSLATGTADELSDVDAGVGYDSSLDPAATWAAALELVQAGGAVADVLAHQLPGWPQTMRRFAVEYADGVQLDLVLMPAEQRPCLPVGAIAVVDKDGTLQAPWRPVVADPPSIEQAREWALLGWWALSDVAKYLAERRCTKRSNASLRRGNRLSACTYATGAQIPFPSFGLVSLLDFPPHSVPDPLAATYCTPDSAANLLEASLATADVLEQAVGSACAALGCLLDTPWTESARRRLAALIGT